jgi:hypothetical protein
MPGDVFQTTHSVFNSFVVVMLRLLAILILLGLWLALLVAQQSPALLMRGQAYAPG